MIKANHASEVREAILIFQFSERFKSELMIVVDLLEEVDRLEGDELIGGKKIVLSLLRSLLGEINLASTILGQKSIIKVGAKIEETMDEVRSDDYSGAIRKLSEAVSQVTTKGGQAMELLKDEGLL